MAMPMVSYDEAPTEAAEFDGFVCGDCRFAQLFAVQPRAVCTHPTAAPRGGVIPAAQPACQWREIAAGETFTLHAF
jgi:hypothetical protein